MMEQLVRKKLKREPFKIQHSKGFCYKNKTYFEKRSNKPSEK